MPSFPTPTPRGMRRRRLFVALGGVIPLSFNLHAQTVADAAAPAPDNVPVKSLGVVTVVGGQPTSLPTQIPATMESVTREQIERTINATDSEHIASGVLHFPLWIKVPRSIGMLAASSRR